MKKLEYSVFAIIAAFMLLTLNGCSEDEYIEDSLPPDLWRVYKDDIAITDTIGQPFKSRCRNRCSASHRCP